jgi:hypothetical protein
MTDQWFYRMFGEEFGPLPLEKLKELAESGTIHAFDQVRQDLTGDWVDAVTVSELGLSTSERPEPVALATAVSLSDFDIATTPQTNDEWYCMVAGAELGPIGFDELLKFAEHEQLGADDQVKLGRNGKWRRAGSIGRLMAALPYQATEKTIGGTGSKSSGEIRIDEQHLTRTAAKSPAPRQAVAPSPAPAVETPDPEATYRAAYEQAKARVAESMIAQADAAFKAAEEQAMAQVAWATAPNVDRYWWGWAGGVEFGPVEFTQVFGLAKSGQLKPSDFVRNGQHAQFVPSTNIPGLFKAIEMIARAQETRNLAKSQAQAAASLPDALPPMPAIAPKAAAPVAKPKSNPAIATIAAPSPTATPARSNPTIDTPRPQPRTGSDPQISAPVARTVEPEPVAPSRPAEEPGRSAPYQPASPTSSGGYSSMNSGFSSSSSSSPSTYGMNRPATPARPVPRKSSASSSTWLSDTLESLKEPKALGAIGAIALVLVIVGWSYMPKSRGADIKRYQAMKQLLDEIKSKRTSAPAELPNLQQKLQKVGKEIATELKDVASREEPAKQCLLWAARDEVPRMVTAGLTMESSAEKSLETRLKEASYELGLEKRPAVDVSQLQARANDD